MIPNFKKSIQSLLVGTLLICGVSVKAQDFGDIIAAGKDDANLYLQNFLAPAMNSFGNGLANGWYNTGRAHKTLGFDITLSFNMAQIPVSERTFQFIASDYSMTLEGDSDGIIPTMVGGESETGAEFVIDPGSVTYNGVTVPINEDIRFDVPSGIDLEEIPVVTGLPVPTLNIGIGVYKNTDLKIRYSPEINIDDFSLNMFGIGVLHDIKQWIPGIKNLPFDLSAMAAYSKITATQGIEVTTSSNGGTTRFSGEGTGEFSAKATTFQVIISKKLTVFTPYAGLGVNSVNSTLAVKGDYEYEVTGDQNSPYEIKDPIDLEFSGAGGPRFTIGGRLKLAVFTFHFDYTAQKYSTITGGVGIAVR